MALLIIVAYNVGFGHASGAVAGGISQLGNTFTGRNAAGNFAGYPA